MPTRNILHDSFMIHHPEEAASVLESFAVQDTLELIADADTRTVGSLLSAMNPVVAADVVAHMEPSVASGTLACLHPLFAASLLMRIEDDLRDSLLSRLPAASAQEIKSFMAYPPESVGSAMDPRVFALPEDLTTEEAIAQIRRLGPKDLSEIYIIDRQQRLVGQLSLRDVFLMPGDERLQAVMKVDVPSIHPMENRESIVELFQERKLLTIPVVDLDGHILGLIRNETILQASQEEATADLQTMVGASREERALSPPLFAVRKRLPWLQINLLTAFLAAFVVGLFESTIARFTALAVLLPVVAGQSGNTGAQSLAVVMRGLALRDIRPSQWFRVSGKELFVAFVNSVAVALTTCLAVYLWSRSGGLTMVIGISMIVSMCIAGLSGALIPIGLKALDQDPAQSSSIILTTVTDVVGFLSFLGLATAFANLLV